MGAPIHDWPAMLPRINELRRKGWGYRQISADLGLTVGSYNGGLRIIKQMGLLLAEITRDGDAPAIVSPAITLEKVTALLSRGMSCAKMADEIGVKRHVVEHVIAKKLTPDQRKAWEAAKAAVAGASKRKVTFAKSKVGKENLALRHKDNIANAKEVADTFQPARRRMGESHPAMAPGGIAWAAIWNGNPPPYPHDMMKGRFS